MPMVATVLALFFAMWSSTALIEMVSVGAILKAQRRGPSCGSTMAPPPASEITGTPDRAATSSTASEVGVSEGPTITSTLSSVISLVAFFAAVVGSVASFSTIRLTFWPPSSVGQSLIVLSAGMPSDAPGPVSETITPTLMSACAAAARPRPTARPSAWRVNEVKERIPVS